MLGHEPMPRHHVERLGDVLADLGQIAAAAARARGRSRMDNAPARHGVPVKSIKTGFERAVKLAGLPGRMTSHTLRHTAATRLMQRGMPIWQAAGYLGMSSQILERVYGHHHPDYMRAAADAIASK